MGDPGSGASAPPFESHIQAHLKDETGILRQLRFAKEEAEHGSKKANPKKPGKGGGKGAADEE